MPDKRRVLTMILTFETEACHFRTTAQALGVTDEYAQAVNDLFMDDGLETYDRAQVTQEPKSTMREALGHAARTLFDMRPMGNC